MLLNNPLVETTSGKMLRRGKGVPQGVATSAILGMLVLEYLNVYDLGDDTYIGFADDGIAGGCSPDLDLKLKAKLVPESGVLINETKSLKVKGRNLLIFFPLWLMSHNPFSLWESGVLDTLRTFPLRLLKVEITMIKTLINNSKCS